MAEMNENNVINFGDYDSSRKEFVSHSGGRGGGSGQGGDGGGISGLEKRMSAVEGK